MKALKKTICLLLAFSLLALAACGSFTPRMATALKKMSALKSFHSDTTLNAEFNLSLLGQELPLEQRDVRIKSRRLVERGTTLSGHGYGLVVSRAREFVRLHACDGIGVGDVSRGLGVPLRTLEARIHESTGSGIHAMIRAVRLQRVCELLKTTDLPIAEVTTRAGYRLTTSLGGIFKKTYGMSMRQYRSAYGQY